jgi:hypothetical protein
MSTQHGYKSTGFKSSKEMAQRLRTIAEFLEDKDEFPMDFYGGYLSPTDGKFSISFEDKKKFTQAVKSIGSAAKHYTEGDHSKLVISADYAPIELNISRDKVCKKVVRYDCEPLFSPEEVEAL